MDGKNNKKKNKKKKGNQNKVAEDTISNTEEVAVFGQANGSSPEQNYRAQSSANGDVPIAGILESDMESERQKMYESRSAALEEEVRKLENERSSWLQIEAGFETKIKRLHEELETCLQHEVRLEEKVTNLVKGNTSLLQKQGTLEEKVKQMEDIKELWNLKEISVKEMIARVEQINQGLQVQVTNLEESKSGLVEENQKLTESISQLELRIEQLEKDIHLKIPSPKVKVLTPEEISTSEKIEANNTQAEDHKCEDTEAADKVDETHIGTNGPGAKFENLSTQLEQASTSVMATGPTDYLLPYGDKMQHVVNDHDTYNITNGMEGFGVRNRLLLGQPLQLDEPRISEEIVQIPLDDVQVPEERTQLTSIESEPVPLTDAPLVGAPFRLISFVAKYVSGADLVPSR